ncbi:hypothetical protein [Peredibacter starrii]|uniref:Type II secretion system protein GspN n=1 Tax=Peredibacter starrii TaxID=28202 RepID=A0AAX4HL74_9BACT|nr:hypothetical protein [Peredibacter starrii]WPU64019.1 hypothetical protein SOO65_15085 [Peredibacter starrii]
MAASVELTSLDNINYKSKIKVIFYVLIVFFLFVFSFMSYYPIGDKLKVFLKSNLKGTGCNPDFDQIRMEWIMPKIVVSGLKLPASCLGRTGDTLDFSHVTLNYQLINFAPFGLPFRLDTELYGQPLTVYFVQGFGQRMVRLKDQTIALNRIQPLLGGNFKLAGNVTVDLSVILSNNLVKSLSLLAESKDLQIPSQSIQGFTAPNLKINTLRIEANSENSPRLNVDKLILGDADSPLRANFKGRIDLQEGAIAFSPINLGGEVAFSETFKQQLPLIDMMFQSFTQKDGFYQIRLGGTLGAPKPSAP